ncbi:regulator of G-protein signaling 3-like [Aulostomus maculatus]
MHTIHRLCRICIGQNLPQVNIVRGKDGFGFTICSDCPVRVQAVDPGGPAHQSGLRQGDSVLQLNGVPVETWKSVDLAYAIRSCPSHIVLVVWRGLPDSSMDCNALLHPPVQSKTMAKKLLLQPTHSKHGCRWGQRPGVRSSLGVLGSLWRDRKEEDKQEEEQEETNYPPHTATLKGTHVTSSQGDNYIILSPVSPSDQLLEPFYQDRNTTIGRLYQTHPSRGQDPPQDPRPTSSQRLGTSQTPTMPTPPSFSISSSALPSNYGNYQNCTIVQSHLPSCASYGTYITLAPKTLIFPIFVQPLDLCSPERMLLMSEEMVLHQADLLPNKVTVLIYTDLLLLTREDDAGHCNVLQSPLYLNSLQLQEVAAEPRHIYFLQSVQRLCLFSLEAFSIEQKLRVSLCLHDNIQQQLVALETGHSPQLPTLPPPSFSPLSSPVWKERGGGEEKHQQGKGESASERSESVGGIWRQSLQLSPDYFTMKEVEEILRRSLSEGSLLQEPRSPCFMSDSTIHRLTYPSFDLGCQPPSPETLRKQLTSEGGHLYRSHHLDGVESVTQPISDLHVCFYYPYPIRAADVQSRLAFLRCRKSSFHGNSLVKALKNGPSAGDVLRWAESLEALLTNQYGLAVFRHFLRSEFSEENLDFWLAVERFKQTCPLSKIASRAAKIYDEFISTTAARQVNVDSSVRELTNKSLCLGVNHASFQLAQDQILTLMETDSYPRFLRSRLYSQLANQSTETVTANQSKVAWAEAAYQNTTVSVAGGAAAGQPMKGTYPLKT